MEQFSLEKWLQDKSRKLVTRDGREVRIICTDLKNKHPIVAAIEIDNHETPYYYDIDGKCLFYDSKDLFFADEEEELTEFENTMVSFAHAMFDHLLDVTKEINIKEWKDKLLDLVRNELQIEFDKKQPHVWNVEDEHNLKAALGYIEDEYLRRWFKDIVYVKFEKQGENSVCKVKVGETYKCIASPRYTCFHTGDIYHVEDSFVAELINTCSDCFVLLEKQDEQNPTWSEEDERIRKALIQGLSELRTCFPTCPTFGGVKVEDILVWLEKQGEQNTANFDEAEKEKNDFVSGQFIECRKSFNEFKECESYWLEYVGDDTYIGRSDNILNQRFHITPQQLFTLFTHQHCPKDNEKQSEQKPAWSEEDKQYLLVCKNALYKYQSSDKWDATIIYNWLEEKLKSLKGGVQPQPKQEWSEDDEEKFRDVIRLVEQGAPVQSIRDHYTNWLKSLKDRFQLQPKQEWSEEDVKMLDSIIDCMDGLCFIDSDQLNWLKSLKDNMQPQPKQEWSEEDERHRKRIVERLEDIRKSKEDNIDVASVILSEINWLKSLKDRIQPQSKYQWTDEDEKNLKDLLAYGETKLGLRRWIAGLPEKLGSRPEYRWKPSEGHLERLDYVIEKFKEDYSPLFSNRIYLTLKALKEQLQKL